MSTPFKPDGYRSVTPYLIVADASAAIDLYTKALGAKERMRMPGGDGKIMHAELEVGDSVIMLADGCPEMGFLDPKAIGGSPVMVMLYLEDVDAVVGKATAAGFTLDRPVADQFYGDRSGNLTDPFGHRWCISTHIEDVSPEEMQKRMAAMGENS